MVEETKLTKKQLKAQQFRKTKDEREQEKDLKRSAPAETTEAPQKKKRKTRRGRGGKGKNGANKGNRFLIFVGGLPKDITATELQAHFKSSSPDQIRIRGDKGIAFLEFDADKDKTGIQRRMDVALLQHRTLLNDKRINVELTVGGGGNSQDRLEKLKNKNVKLDEERRERLHKMMQEGAEKKRTEAAAPGKSTSTSSGTGATGAIHPDRAKLLQK
ncbi:hypothetical protein NCAS_0D00410 [Naumovozyma castellii]|uniref:RRM domain-containing protein n=1 Tax=Naumovozyma castellii TaxID=27288 RepID=G0VF03_NAUCA|nr:hypothetical protein NCAS_0D00410 [Naumovozyma castellii CBS 4309]CCC69622.1 hypothetical protein NCAS_0D00410 [Naumovozyma castellii CBS 4309]